MKKYFVMASALVGCVLVLACGPKLSKDQYVQIMTEIGCKSLSEIQPGAQEIYKNHNASQADINEYRIKGDRADIVNAATEIATKVAACHGVNFNAP